MRNRRDDKRRGSDRRTGDRRHNHGSNIDVALLRGMQHIPTWEDQRSQYLTRLLFCGLAVAYFNFGGEAQIRPWASVLLVNVVMSLYAVEILGFMWHAQREPHVPWRQHLTMWIDIAAASFSALADATLSTPAFLVFLMIILGNGMRYGLKSFAEAVIGCFAASIFIVWVRLPDYLAMVSVSAIFFLLFFAIIVLYAYSLTAKIERTRAKLAHERNIDALTGMLNRRALDERVMQLFHSSKVHGREAVVLFADLDGFKNVNDTHGHHVGDRVLVAVAECIRESYAASMWWRATAATNFCSSCRIPRLKTANWWPGVSGGQSTNGRRPTVSTSMSQSASGTIPRTAAISNPSLPPSTRPCIAARWNLAAAASCMSAAIR